MKPVLITTEFRGVFFGYIEGEPDTLPEKVTIKHARNCVYWSADCKGVFGLAVKGPTSGCKVGPEMPELTIYKVTSITNCTPEAAEAWKKEIWS